MSKEHLENIAFDFIRYANCWEDVELLIEAFDLNQKSKVISIASGGDNCFSLVAQGPEIVVAVDISAVQLYLVELKKVAIQQLDREEYLQFAGFTESNSRAGTFDRLSIHLSPEAKEYWNQHLNEIEEGIIHIGKFERYFQLFKPKFLHGIHEQSTIDGLFKEKSEEEQLKYYHDNWYHKDWQQMHRSFFSEQMLGEKGRDPEFMKQIEGSVSDLILEREVAHLKSKLCQSNPFLFYILNNRFDELHLPHYVRRENYDAVKKNIDKLVLREGLLGKIASEYPEFTHFNLSNIFEYMELEHFNIVGNATLNNAADGALLAYWNFMIPRNLIEILPERVIDLNTKSQQLSEKDMGYFYKDFVLNQKK